MTMGDISHSESKNWCDLSLCMYIHSLCMYVTFNHYALHYRFFIMWFNLLYVFPIKFARFSHRKSSRCLPHRLCPRCPRYSPCPQTGWTSARTCTRSCPGIRLHPDRKVWKSALFHRVDFSRLVALFIMGKYWEIRIRNYLKSIVPLRSSSINAMKVSSYYLVGLWPRDLSTVFSSYRYITICTLLLIDPSPSLSNKANASRN